HARGRVIVWPPNYGVAAVLIDPACCPRTAPCPSYSGEGMTGSPDTWPGPNPYTSHWRPRTTTEFTHRSPAAPSLRRAGPRSRPFVLAMLRALRLDRRPSPGAARTEAEMDENNTTNC